MSYRISQMPRIYIDNASTTPIDPRVFDSMVPFLTGSFGNPSSVHGFGQESRNAIDKARRHVAGLIKSRPNEIVFTSGGTESNNLAIRGLASRFPGGHIVTSAIEHSAVREVLRELGKEGFDVTEIAPDEKGFIDPERVRNEIREDTFLVSVMLANNELGTVQDLRRISEIVKGFRDSGQEIFLHSDAVQALGKIAIDSEQLGCDLLSFSAHKLYAPKGAGALFIRSGVKLIPVSKGGPHERGLRPGTENVPGIVAFGEACSICAVELEAEHERVFELRERFEASLNEHLPGVTVNSGGNRLPGISNVSFAGISGEALLIHLDQRGIAVSTGSACASGTIEPSHVLLAIGRSEETARSSLRFSFGRFNSLDDVQATIEALKSAIKDLRRSQS